MDDVTNWADPGYNMGGAPMATTPAASSRTASSLNQYTSYGMYGQAAGTILAFTGQILAASAAKKAANYNSQVISANAQAAANAAEIEAQQHERNAAIAAQDILLAQQAQQEQEHQQRQQQAYVAGQTSAIVGASGLLMKGSPLAAYEFNLRQSERQILAGRYKEQLQERALRDQQVQENYAATVARYGAGERLRVGAGQAQLAQVTGSQQAAASLTGAFGSLASGGARTAALYERSQAGRQGTLIDPGY